MTRRSTSARVLSTTVSRTICQVQSSCWAGPRMLSADDYDSRQETVYLLRSPENARRLMEAVARDKAGHSGFTKSLDELREMAGGEE